MGVLTLLHGARNISPCSAFFCSYRVIPELTQQQKKKKTDTKARGNYATQRRQQHTATHQPRRESWNSRADTHIHKHGIVYPEEVTQQTVFDIYNAEDGQPNDKETPKPRADCECTVAKACTLSIFQAASLRNRLAMRRRLKTYITIVSFLNYNCAYVWQSERFPARDKTHSWSLRRRAQCQRQHAGAKWDWKKRSTFLPTYGDSGTVSTGVIDKSYSDFRGTTTRLCSLSDSIQKMCTITNVVYSSNW